MSILKGYRKEQIKATSEVINDSVDSIVKMFTDTISRLEREESKAVVAIEQTEQKIQTLQAEKASLETVKSRITAMADKIRSLVE